MNFKMKSNLSRVWNVFLWQESIGIVQSTTGNEESIAIVLGVGQQREKRVSSLTGYWLVIGWQCERRYPIIPISSPLIAYRTTIYRASSNHSQGMGLFTLSLKVVLPLTMNRKGYPVQRNLKKKNVHTYMCILYWKLAFSSLGNNMVTTNPPPPPPPPPLT